jgi:hypothetical protein
MSDFCGHNGVPGGVYLCQVNEQISCGACCGLYNVAEPTYEALLDVLLKRTEAFERVERSVDALVSFQKKIRQKECQERPLPEFHHCPFLGLVGDGLSRVGCLLHPRSRGNKGVDLRGMSFYGGMACRVYFCPAHRELAPSVKEIVRQAATNWYIYGLVVTETDLLNAFFQAVEARIHRRVEKEDMMNEACFHAVRAFFDLKVSWPFRHRPYDGLGNYFFEDNLYERPPVDYGISPHGQSRYDVILRALESCFLSPGQLREAEGVIGSCIDALVAAILSHGPRMDKESLCTYSASAERQE